MLYGSSRLGSDRRGGLNETLLLEEAGTLATRNPFTGGWFLFNFTPDNDPVTNAYDQQKNKLPVTQTHYLRGHKRYELSNHLGNVLATVSDKRVVTSTKSLADIHSLQDYYPFGMTMKGRSASLQVNGGTTELAFQIDVDANPANYQSLDKYRFGFNGMEKDDELKGAGNSYDFGARLYDPRLGRWLTVDPKVSKYPAHSPYNFAMNMPVVAKDPDGKVVITATIVLVGTGATIVTVYVASEIASNSDQSLLANIGDDFNRALHYLLNSSSEEFPSLKKEVSLPKPMTVDDLELQHIAERGEEIEIKYPQDDGPGEPRGGKVGTAIIIAGVTAVVTEKLLKTWDGSYRNKELTKDQKQKLEDRRNSFLSGTSIEAVEVVGHEDPTLSTVKFRLSKKIEVGDNLGWIAKDNNTTVERLLELNPQIIEADKITAGEKIFIDEGSFDLNVETKEPKSSDESARHPMRTSKIGIRH